MHRNDLVRAAGPEPLEVQVARARELLEAAVKPEWRRDRLIVIRKHYIQAFCGVTECRREAVSNGMCNGHALRWMRAGRPDLPGFMAATDHVLRGHHRLKSCLVPECRYGRHEHQMCWRHAREWVAAGEPTKERWAATATVTVIPDRLCRLPNCDLGVEGRSEYCRSHWVRWRNQGRPSHEEFESAVMNYGDPTWDFRRLPDQLKLELQYALQRNDELDYASSSHTYSWVVRALVRLQATTLLEHDRDTWRTLLLAETPHSTGAKNYIAFLSFAIEQLLDLLEGAGWEREYPRDVWQLRRLGYVSASNARRLSFVDITQPWLLDCAKRWLHWRLTVEEKSINTANADLMALRRLSQFLSDTSQAQYSIRQLTRPVIEQHIAWLHQQPNLASTATIRDSISAVAVFLRALQDHEDWAPDLPRNAVIYSSDYPRMLPLRARGLSPQVMAQVRARLPEWRHPSGRFLTELMLATGLRVGDACALTYHPIVLDRDNNPYIRYWNHKMRREAFVPISAATMDRIAAQQARVRALYPRQVKAYQGQPAAHQLPVDGLRLIPAIHKNPNGNRRFAPSAYNGQLREWLAATHITDDGGRPVAITAHQWRHTFATTLVNKGVRLEVVKQLLDHASLEMASHYARLLDTTIRAEWEAGRDDDQDLSHLLPADVEWANRARTALPNGHCGLPRQQSCDHSNKCLTCPVFITTSTDLPAHEEQRRRTLTLITRFDEQGNSVLADKNRLVLEQLDARITQIKQSLAAAETARDAS